jgi:pimeloyl-ACP methyl ester carboxylesterase
MLAHERVTSDEPPDRWMLFLHGILGRRANWRSFARSYVDRRPGWGAVLVDLREHGDSLGIPGPHTVDAAGEDLVALAASVVAAHGGRVAGVLGHSFGGKVAIVGASRLRAIGEGVDELWIIDAPVGPRTQPRDLTTERVFETLTGLAPEFESRTNFIDAVIAVGVARPIAQWLATNLVASEAGGWRFALELAHVRALLEDFKSVDLWPLVDAEAEAGTRVSLVIGDRSEAVFGEELAQANRRAGLGLIDLFTVADAGHWVHVDNAAGLLDVLVGSSEVARRSGRASRVVR